MQKTKRFSVLVNMIANYVCRVVPAFKLRLIRVPDLPGLSAIVDGDSRLLFDDETNTVRIMSDDYDENGLLDALKNAVGEEQRDKVVYMEQVVPETEHNEWQFVPSLRLSDLTDIVDLHLTNHTQLSKIPLPRIGDLAVLESGVCLNMCLGLNVAKMDLGPGSSANVRILRFDTATRRILSAALPPQISLPVADCGLGGS